jgi:hypothetical protein
MEKKRNIFAEDTAFSTSDVSFNRALEVLTHDLLNAPKK